MFKNSSKILFFFSLISGTIITISSNSWIGAWMGLEINLLSFIPLMINTNNLLSTEASLKYFLTQALASSLLLFSIIMYMFMFNMNFTLSSNFNYLFLMISSTLLLKSGAAPFHFWFPGVMEGINWMNNLILMTWQKIAPMMMISYCLVNDFMLIIAVLSVFIGSIGGLNHTSLRKIMAFSSINHLGWMIAAMISSENLWLIYFMIYSFLSFTMVFMFNSFKLYHINQSFSLFCNFPVMKHCMFLSLLSLGGLPPFLGFLPKWLVIQSMACNSNLMIITLMTCLTLVTLYFYMRICYAAFMLNYWEINWNFKSFYANFNMKMTFLLSFISTTGLILFNLIFTLN
uniref:NADH dehydrogenase subunit 2 n=1 Tax=Limonia phragmitidis TaxID=2599951 RepID=UPI0011EA0F7C|nr:NADH dehydrogenase subunit 2 [Limonia phragmitidis]QDX14937.1 NADH dehydrogenase subunit 2 [Limonia phragmitidis]